MNLFSSNLIILANLMLSMTDVKSIKSSDISVLESFAICLPFIIAAAKSAILSRNSFNSVNLLRYKNSVLYIINLNITTHFIYNK